VIFCAMGILIAQIAAGSDVLILYFPMPVTWAAIALLAPVVLATLAGGMRSLTIANMLAMWVIGAALLLPAIWLSARITGNPIPQWSYGSGALQPILQLEEQLAQLSETQAASGRGNFAEISGGLGFLATILCMMAGTAALPLLYSRITCSTGIATRTRSIGWILVFVALLASIMPAFVIFINFEIYRDVVGLPVNELEDGIDWLMNWASFGRGNHALVCGSPAYDIQAITAACGNDPDHVLVPSDLHFSPLMTLLGAGTIADMPSVYSAITFAGLLSASATTAGIAMMVIVNTANDELIFPDNFISGKNSTSRMPAPIARRLFVSRLLLIVLCVSGIWLAEIIPAPATDFTLWAFGLAAGAIFPVLVLSIWWKPITTLGGLTGVISGFFVTFYLTVSIEYGPDWIAQNGDESIWLIPLSGEPVRAINAAIIGIPIAVITIIAVSTAEKHIRNRRRFPNKPEIKAKGGNWLNFD
jgi:cation/acetate symporter